MEHDYLTILTFLSLKIVWVVVPNATKVKLFFPIFVLLQYCKQYPKCFERICYLALVPDSMDPLCCIIHGVILPLGELLRRDMDQMES